MTHPFRPAGITQTLVRDGRAVTIEAFAPAGKDAGATGLVILLHDAQGPGPDRPVRAEAAALAQGGFRVLLPHDLDRTGEAQVGFSGIFEKFGLWRAAVEAVLSRFRKSAPRFSDKNLRHNKTLSGRSVGLPTQVCLGSRQVPVVAPDRTTADPHPDRSEPSRELGPSYPGATSRAATHRPGTSAAPSRRVAGMVLPAMPAVKALARPHRLR